MVNPKKEYSEIGMRIREARESCNLSQRELAEKVGFESATAISYIEAGERKVSVVDLRKIADALDRDFQFFLGQEASNQNVRIALRAEKGLTEQDQVAILHIIEMAKARSKKNGK